MNEIVHGDCIAVMRDLKRESIDLVFADPPFNIDYKYDVYKDRLHDDDYLDWSERWMKEAIRVLKPNGAFWLAIGDKYAAELKVFAARVLRLTCRNWVIWYYTFGTYCQRKFGRDHTHLLYFIKDPKNFTFNSNDIRIPSARQTTYNDKRADSKGRVPGDVWMVPRVCGTFKERQGFHGCQMPEEILERIIKACSNERDMVLDPFAGSATTLVVAKKLNRQFVGIEISSDYVVQGRKRLAGRVRD